MITCGRAINPRDTGDEANYYLIFKYGESVFMSDYDGRYILVKNSVIIYRPVVCL